MGNAGTNRARCARNGVIGAALVLASSVGVAPVNVGAADVPQQSAEAFIEGNVVELEQPSQGARVA